MEGESALTFLPLKLKLCGQRLRGFEKGEGRCLGAIRNLLSTVAGHACPFLLAHHHHCRISFAAVTILQRMYLILDLLENISILLPILQMLTRLSLSAWSRIAEPILGTSLAGLALYPAYRGQLQCETPPASQPPGPLWPCLRAVAAVFKSL